MVNLDLDEKVLILFLAEIQFSFSSDTASLGSLALEMKRM